MWLPHPKPPPIAAERFATIGDPEMKSQIDLLRLNACK
jgi:hypothetical protein